MSPKVPKKILSENNEQLVEILTYLILRVDKEITEDLKGILGRLKDGEKLEARLNRAIANIKNGEDGKDYVLTEEDRTAIASGIKVPVVEKIVEKTEVIREQPIVVEKAMHDSGDTLVRKINALDILPELQIDAKHIKNLPTPAGPTIVNRYHSTEFIRLEDTPDEYVAGKFLKVSADATRLEFVDEPSGGSGYSVETPVGDVDGSNNIYTVTVAPVFIVSDGIVLFEGMGYLLAALTITLDNAPNQYIRSFYIQP